VSDSIAETDQEWSAARDAITSEAEATVNQISIEMEAVSSRIDMLHDFLTRAGREMAALESTAQSAMKALQEGRKIPQEMSRQDVLMQKARADFGTRVVAEMKLADAALDEGREKIEALEEKLQAIRDWGRRR
jgi:hypothetical protein